MAQPNFTDTVPDGLADVPTVPGALWAQADGEDGQFGICVTLEGAGSFTINTAAQRLTVQVSQTTMVAVSAMSAAAAKAMARFDNKRDIA